MSKNLSLQGNILIKIIFVLLLLFGAQVLLKAVDLDPSSNSGMTMPDIPEDSVLDLNSLRPDSLHIMDDFSTIASYGWFPRPLGWMTNISLSVDGRNLFATKDFIDSKAFIAPKYPFMNFQQMEDDERKIKKTFSKDDESDYPATSLTIYGLRFYTNFKTPFIFRLNVGYLSSETCFYSSDNTREFLQDDGTKRKFNEVNVFYVDERGINIGIGLEIPVWGALIFGDQDIASYYYLFGNYSCDFIFRQRATQFIQNANVKDEIKYRSGTDTVRLFFENDPTLVNTLRNGLEVGLGWNLQMDNIGLKFEIYYEHPLTPFFKDADNKIYCYGVRLYWNILGILERIF